jgi:hypothetical protein
VFLATSSNSSAGHLSEGRSGAGFYAEIIVDDRTEEGVVIGLLIVRKCRLELRSLKIEHPGKLLGTLQNSPRERLKIGRREELDKLGIFEGGRLGIERVENAHGVDAIGVFYREIDRSGSRRVVSDRNDLIEAQCRDDRFEVAELLLEAVGRPGGLFGSAEAEEIERDDPPASGYQIRNEIIVDVQIIREAVH